jgi:hypothetical protein
MKLDWLPASKRQRVSFLSPVGPVSHMRGVCKWVKSHDWVFIWFTDVDIGRSALKMEWWWIFLHFEQWPFPFLLQSLMEWPRFRHSKQRDVSFNFSVRSLTSVTSLQSWAQWPLLSQNTQKDCCQPFDFSVGGLVDFVWTWKKAVVGIRGSRPVTSPRIFRVIIAHSTSFKKGMSLVMSPSESWSRFAWMIHRRHISYGKAWRILGVRLLP